MIWTLTLLGLSLTTDSLSQKAIAQNPCVGAQSCSTESKDSPELILYGGPRTRASIVQWYLEELSIPYRYISLDLSKDEHRHPDYLAINPMGKVPALVKDDFRLWESGAILLYLGEKYGDPSLSLEDRSLLNQWVLFANATLGPGLFNPEHRERAISRLLPPLNNVLQTKPFLVGRDLSVADVAVASYLYYAKRLISVDFSAYPALEKYLERLGNRPAFQLTLGQR